MAGEETDKPKREKKQRGEIVDIVAHVKKLEEDLIPHTITEKLSRLSDIWIEEYTSPSGLAGAVAHFGHRIPRAEMDAFVKPILDARPQKDNGLENKPIGYDHGFGAIWRTPEGYTQDEIDNDTFETALRLAKRTLRLKGWSARDVDVVDFANSAAAKGMSEVLKRKLIEELRMREDVEVKGTFLACDGAGNALYERLKDSASKGVKGQKVLLLSVDQITAEMPLDESKVDPLTMQIFSNGAAALAYEVGEEEYDLKLLTGTTATYEDTKRALTASPRYVEAIKKIDALSDEEKQGLIRDGIIYRISDNEWAIKLPEPEPGQKGEMSGADTAKFFVFNALKNIPETYKKYKQMFGDREPDYAIAHHPSYPTLLFLQKLLAKKDVNLPLKWIVPEGNSSGATSLIAFVRSMEKFKPGDHVMYVSFGAGGSFTSFVVEIGGKNAKKDKGAEVVLYQEPQSVAA